MGAEGTDPSIPTPDPTTRTTHEISEKEYLIIMEERTYTTQMDAARKGIVTPQLKAVAEKEYLRTV